jgi:hypothetical protein
VVGHLQEVRRDRATLREEARLGGSLHVASQEEAPSPVPKPEDEGLVVAGSAGAGACFPPRRGVEHLQPHAAEMGDESAPRQEQPRAAFLRRLLERPESRVVESRGADPDRLGTEHPDDRRRAAEMVLVRVGDDEEIEAQHPEGAQGRRDDACSDIEVAARQSAGIHEQGAALRRPHQEGVSLPDVEGDEIEPPGGLRIAAAPGEKHGDDRGQGEERATWDGAARECRSARQHQEERGHPPRGRLDEKRRGREIRRDRGAAIEPRDER